MDPRLRDPALVRLYRKLDRAVAKAAIARDMQVAAETRAHDLKLRAKAAESSERSLEKLLTQANGALLAYAKAYPDGFNDDAIMRAVEFAKKRDGWKDGSEARTPE